MDRVIAQAWWGANLANAKKLPQLSTLLNRGRGKKQTMEQQRSMLAMLSEQYGIPLRKAKKKKKKTRATPDGQ